MRSLRQQEVAEKEVLRKILIPKLRKLACLGSQKVVSNFLQFLSERPNFRSQIAIGVYCPMASEVQIQSLPSDLAHVCPRWAIPKRDSMEVWRFEWRDFPDGTIPNYRSSQMMTEGGYQADPKDFDLLLVPGVAFDRSGFRLGRGLGFYDRVLMGTSALKVGLIFEEAFFEELPRDPWDQAVDFVITEVGVYQSYRR